MKGSVIGRVAPWHQMNWDWRAAGNFIGGGSGTGVLFFAAIMDGSDYGLPALLGMALVGAGLFCVWLEIGRPWRAMNVFKHARTSWMSREALVAPPLFLCALAAVVTGDATLAWIAAAVALGFLYCQARILRAAKGIPAWRQPLIVPLIMLTGLAEGAGWLALVTQAAIPVGAPGWIPWALAATVLARVLLWRTYCRRLRSGRAPRGTLVVLGRFDRPFVVANLLAGILAPAAALPGAAWLLVPAGLLALAGGWALKFTLVARAAFNQGFAIPRTPARGAGLTGDGSRPGWSA
jgi:phenylacetyl-CoA:acceptor oxidoreductase subunit 2